MTESIQLEILQSILGDFIDETNFCDPKMKKMLSLMQHKDHDILLTILTGQKSVSSINPQYSIYAYNIIKKNFLHILDLKDDDQNECIYLQYNQNELQINIISTESMLFYLSDINTRYVYFHAILTCENKNCNHQVCLIIDRLKNEAYFYDPNGRSSYFDNIFIDEAKKHGLTENLNDLHFDGESAINDMFKSYFAEIKNKVGIDIKFVPSIIWNPQNYVINPSFDKEVLIGSGHCVITTILFVHLLNILQEDITVVFNLLGQLSKEQLIYIINGYSCGIYNVMRNIFEKYMQNEKYKKYIELP